LSIRQYTVHLPHTGSSLYTRLYRPEKNFADANWNLVVAFANWGYTLGDPSTSEGEKFLAGLNALGRLLAVGSEWGSYAAAPALGGGARRVVREAAEEASEQLARQGVRQAARELERKAVGSAAASSVRAIVIGENMSRVRAAAKALGASYTALGGLFRSIVAWHCAATRFGSDAKCNKDTKFSI
jgi:hypothetical protein